MADPDRMRRHIADLESIIVRRNTAIEELQRRVQYFQYESPRQAAARAWDEAWAEYDSYFATYGQYPHTKARNPYR